MLKITKLDLTHRQRFFLSSTVIQLILFALSIYWVLYFVGGVLWMKWVLILAINVFIYLILRYIVKHVSQYWIKKDAEQSGLNWDDDFKVYDCARELLPFVKKPYTKAVLLLHGFSGTTWELKPLAEALDKERILFYGPLLRGFGTYDLSELSHIEYKQWVNQALAAYDFLEKLADEVIVVGYSVGSLLGLHISQVRPISKLILLCPFLIFPIFWIRAMLKIANIPVIGVLLRGFYPFGLKPTAEYLVSERFSTQILPIEALIELLRLQKNLHFSKMKIKSMFVVFTNEDQMIRFDDCKNMLDKINVDKKIKEYPAGDHLCFYGESAEKILEDVLKQIK